MVPGEASVPSDSGGTAGPDHDLSVSERAEYERLRRAAGTRHRRVRRAGASVLLVLSLLLAPLAVVAAWVQDTVSDTDRYVQTVAPLSSDPAVQTVVTDRLTDRVVDNVDVEAVTASLAKALADAGASPRVVDGAQALTAPLRSAVRSVVYRTVSRVVTGDTFQQAWEGANRRAHAAVLNMLTGERQGALQATGETVELDIGAVVDQARQRLVGEGFEKAAAIPDTDRTFTLFQTENLDKAQDTMRVLDIIGTWLPVLTVAFAALAVWTAPGHRVMLLVTAVGIGVMMVVLLVALAVVLVTALAACLYGPGRAARGVRTVAQRGATATGRMLSRAGVRTGPTGRRLAAHQAWTTGIAIGAGALALVLWNHPTVGGVTLVLGLVLAVMAVLAVLAATEQTPAAPAREQGRAGP